MGLSFLDIISDKTINLSCLPNKENTRMVLVEKYEPEGMWIVYADTNSYPSEITRLTLERIK